MVPLVRVRFLQSVKLPPHQGVVAQVRVDGSWSKRGPLLLEHDNGTELDTGVQVEDALLQRSEKGFPQLLIVNPSGLKQVAEEGCVIGKAEAVSVALEEDQVEQLEPSAEPKFACGSVLRVASDSSDDITHKARLMEMIK